MSPRSAVSLLALSLGGIFAAGGAVGYWVGRGEIAAPIGLEDAIGSAPGASPQRWAEQALERLAGDLQLTGEQRLAVQPHLEVAADRIFRERDRALLQMHLRLLEVHDTLARELGLEPGQAKRLAQSRAKLKASILARFASLLQAEHGSLPEL